MKANELLKRANDLVGNPLTNISGSTDMACEQWRKDYEEYIKRPDQLREAVKKCLVKADELGMRRFGKDEWNRITNNPNDEPKNFKTLTDYEMAEFLIEKSLK